MLVLNRFIISLVLLITATYASAQTLEKILEKPVTRQWRLGVSAGQLLSKDLGPVSRPLLGPMLRYEFVLAPRFTLGIHTSYRYGKETTGVHQFVYGLVMQHNIGPKENPWPFYVSYGLLLQVFKKSGVEGRGTAHDTRFALGGEFDLWKQTHFVELGFNYSRMVYFASPSQSLDHFDFTYGVKV